LTLLLCTWAFTDGSPVRLSTGAGLSAAAERLISVITNAAARSNLFTMFLLWSFVPTESDFAFAKIARRVYAVARPNAIEKKVSTPWNPVLRKPFGMVVGE
jgi:hypothetical protein